MHFHEKFLIKSIHTKKYTKNSNQNQYLTFENIYRFSCQIEKEIILPDIQKLNFLFQASGKKLLSQQLFKFHPPLKQQFNDLGIKQLLNIEQKQKISEDGSKLTISGGIIQLAKPLQLNKKIKLVQIQALFEFEIIPSELQFKGVDISIISPLWLPRGDNNITLVGDQGESYQTRAKDGLNLQNYQNPSRLKDIQFTQLCGVARDGSHGYPGKPGPSFLGIGKLLKNTRLSPNSCLKITSVGGDGGTGQDGGNGGVFLISQKYKNQLLTFNGRPGRGGLGAGGGILQCYIKNNQKATIQLLLKDGKQGKIGKAGQPGWLFEPVYHYRIIYSAGQLSPSPIPAQVQPLLPKPVEYDCVINYQNYLLQFFTGKGVQKDIACLNLLWLISQNLIKSSSVKPKIEIKHLISESNIVTKLYMRFLFEKDFLSNQQITGLVTAFKSKLTSFVLREGTYFTINQEKLLRKIAVNFLIMENSLKSAYAVLNFDYLNYFLNKVNSSFLHTKILEQHSQAKQQYKTKLINKIKQAQQVTNEMQTQISVITDKINKQTKQLQKQLRQAQQQKEKYAEQLKKQLPWRILGKVFGFMEKVTSFLGAVGAELGLRSGLIDTLVQRPEPLSGKNLNPSTYMNMDNGLKEIEIKQVIKQLRSIVPNLPTEEQIMMDINFNNQLQKYLDITQKGLDQATSTLEQIIKDKKKKQLQQTGNDNSDNKKETDAVKKKYKLLSVRNSLKAISVANGGVQTVKECFDAVDEVKQAFKDSEEFRKMRMQIENFINSTFGNFMKKMGEINEIFSVAGSQARVMFLEYGFAATLNDILQYFKKTFKEFNSDSKQDLYYLLTKLESATQSLSQIYGVIDSYKSQGELAQLIIDINTPLGEDTEKFYPGLTELEKDFQKLLVYNQGSMILSSFKQSTFPRSPYYSYDTYYKVTQKELTASIEDMMNQLRNIYQQHNINKYMIGTEGQAFIKSDSNSVFYTCSKRYEIVNLLKGEDAVIMPDVRTTPKDRDAVKFTTINIRFQLQPGATNEQKISFQKIKDQLENSATVQMTSSGNYYYRYNETYYNLPSVQLALDRSYKVNGTVVNKVYDLVSKGEPMFSPYTSWKLKLKGIDFSDQNFQENVKNCRSKLELTFYGSAVYIDKESFGGKASVVIPVHQCYRSFQTKVFSILPKY